MASDVRTRDAALVHQQREGRPLPRASGRVATRTFTPMVSESHQVNHRHAPSEHPRNRCFTPALACMSTARIPRKVTLMCVGRQTLSQRGGEGDRPLNRVASTTSDREGDQEGDETSQPRRLRACIHFWCRLRRDLPSRSLAPAMGTKGGGMAIPILNLT